MSEPYLVTKIRAWALFNNAKFDDVVSVSATFALNSIPTASVVVAVGRTGEPRGNGQGPLATIHSKLKALRPRDKATIFAQIEEIEGQPITAIKPGIYKIFDGYIAGMGYQRSNNHANYVINLVHWLDDLNNSSAINGNWFPGVPHDWAQQALFDRAEANGTSAGALVPMVSRKLANYNNLSDDLWKKTIKPLFETMAGFSGDVVQERYPSGDGVLQKNDAAKEALNRMPGDGSAYYRELAMRLGGGQDENFDTSVAAFFEKTLGSSFVQNTIWSKLINEYASQFLFAISPAVEWALPIPFCAGLRWKDGEAKTITAKEYNYANFNANMSQIIEAVYVHYPAASATNVPDHPFLNKRLSFYKPWGYFPKEDNTPKRGLKLFKNAPGWLTNLNPQQLAALVSALGVRDANAIRPNTKNSKIVDTTTEHEKRVTVIDNFARHWYYTEILQQRYGELSGPLRFDIAPGSIVKIVTPKPELDFGAKDTFVIASVISTSYVINAERATVGTSFTIAHTKSPDENTDDLYSTPEVPLYRIPFYSGPLAEPR